MRSVRLGLLSGFAALVALGAMDSAEAGSRWKFRYYDAYPEYESFYPGPIFIPPPRYYKYNRYSAYEDDYDDDEFDPDYYEPQYAPPGAPKKKLKRSQPVPQASKPSTTTKKKV